MTRTRIASVALASTAVMGVFAAFTPTATADDSVPCPAAQAQLDRATAKLADLKAKFAAHPTTKNLKAKKAQAQRVGHASARLDNCGVAPTPDDAED